MNWTKASAIGEILSSIAILATLVYLGTELFDAEFQSVVSELIVDAPIFEIPRHTTTFD